MKKWIGGLFLSNSKPDPQQEESRGEQPPVSPGNQPDVGQRAEAQVLRLEIASQQEQIEHLKQEIERLRYRQDRLVEEGAAATVETLLAELAGPVSQLRAQSALHEQGKPLQARDVLAVGGRVIRALERHGLVFVDQPGEKIAFDPNRHTPLSADCAPQAGSEVIVRFAGVSYRGKILYKAVVEACQDD